MCAMNNPLMDRNNDEKAVDEGLLVYTRENAERFCAVKDAVMTDDIETVESFLSVLDNERQLQRDAYVAIQMAACFNRLKVLQYLCSTYKCNHHSEYKIDSPLHTAVKLGNKRAVRILLAEDHYSFCLALRDKKARTPLHLVVIEGDRKVTEAFDVVFAQLKFNERLRAACNWQDNNGYTVLHYAVIYERVKLMRKLGSQNPGPVGDNFDEPRSRSNSAIHLAALSRNPEVLPRVLQVFYAGALKRYSVSERDCKGVTPLMICADRGDIDGVALLMDYGADPRVVDAKGRNVIHRLVLSSKEDAGDPRKIEERRLIIRKIRNCVENRNVLYTFGSIAAEAKAPFPENVEKYTNGLTAMQMASAMGSAVVLQEIIDGSRRKVKKNELDEHEYDLAGIIPTVLQQQQQEERKETRDHEPTCLELIINECNRKNERPTFSEMMKVEPLKTFVDRFAMYRYVIVTVFMLVHIFHMLLFSVFITEPPPAAEQTQNNTANGTSIRYDKTLTNYWYISLFSIYPVALTIYEIYRLGGSIAFINETINSFREWDQRPLLFYYLIFETLSHIITVCFCCLTLTWFVMQIAAGCIGYVPRGYWTIVALYLYVGWVYTLDYLRGMPIFHSITAFLKVIVVVDILKILFIYAFLIIGFALAIHARVNLGKRKNYQREGVTQIMFESLGMLMGVEEAFHIDDEQIDFRGTKSQSVNLFVRILIASYLILSVTMLMSLIIAMINTTYKQVRKEHKELWYFENAKYIVNFMQRNDKFLDLLRTVDKSLRCTYGIMADKLPVEAKRSALLPRVILSVLVLFMLICLIVIFK